MEGTHAYLCQIHIDVWQKPLQCCNYLPIKINFKKYDTEAETPIL